LSEIVRRSKFAGREGNTMTKRAARLILDRDAKESAYLDDAKNVAASTATRKQNGASVKFCRT
jgi:hypothetical protein